MILDTSAILAIFLKEPGDEAIMDCLAAEDEVGIGAPTLTETGIVLEARFGASASGWPGQPVSVTAVARPERRHECPDRSRGWATSCGDLASVPSTC